MVDYIFAFWAVVWISGGLHVCLMGLWGGLVVD